MLLGLQSSSRKLFLALQVDTTKGIQVGQWLRLFAQSPNAQNRRRHLMSEEGSAGLGRKLRHFAASSNKTIAEQLFNTPSLQKAFAAALAAEVQLDSEIAAGKVPANAYEPNITNPLGMDPLLLTFARYAASAALAEQASGTVEAAALSGTLDAYLYGNIIADSGKTGGECACDWSPVWLLLHSSLRSDVDACTCRPSLALSLCSGLPPGRSHPVCIQVSFTAHHHHQSKVQMQAHLLILHHNCPPG